MRAFKHLVGIAVAGLLTAPAAAQQAKPEKLVVAAAPTPLLHWYPFYVALGAKYFADEGLDVEIVGLNSGTAMAAAIAGGGADVSPLAMTHAIASAAQGGGLVATAALFNVYPNSVVLTKDAMAKSGCSPAASIPIRRSSCSRSATRRPCWLRSKRRWSTDL
jgi:NitT/TauT family transport system substrate-binding protein